MTPEQIANDLAQHALWKRGEGGKRLDWSGADMRGANMCGANMRDANMRDANMRDANMCDADMRGANMCGANMRDADMCDADMRYADMRGADMRGADMCGVIGNMREVKSAQFDTWSLTWINDRLEGSILQIGCQRHPVETWRAGSDEWIAAMDGDALDWWRRHKALVLSLVDGSPAVLSGREDDA